MKPDRVHIVPVNDIQPHNTIEETCNCNPRTEATSEGVLVIHNAFDGRSTDNGLGVRSIQ